MFTCWGLTIWFTIYSQSFKHKQTTLKTKTNVRTTTQDNGEINGDWVGAWCTENNVEFE